MSEEEEQTAQSSIFAQSADAVSNGINVIATALSRTKNINHIPAKNLTTISGIVNCERLGVLGKPVALKEDLNNKANASHTHTLSDITDYTNHTHLLNEINEEYEEEETYQEEETYEEEEEDGQGNVITITKTRTVDKTRTITKTKPLNEILDEKVDTSELNTVLSGKADTNHTHSLADITDYESVDLTQYFSEQMLTSALSTKANTQHRHSATDVYYSEVDGIVERTVPLDELLTDNKSIMTTNTNNIDTMASSVNTLAESIQDYIDSLSGNSGSSSSVAEHTHVSGDITFQTQEMNNGETITRSMPLNQILISTKEGMTTNANNIDTMASNVSTMSSSVNSLVETLQDYIETLSNNGGGTSSGGTSGGNSGSSGSSGTSGNASAITFTYEEEEDGDVIERSVPLNQFLLSTKEEMTTNTNNIDTMASSVNTLAECIQDYIEALSNNGSSSSGSSGSSVDLSNCAKLDANNTFTGTNTFNCSNLNQLASGLVENGGAQFLVGKTNSDGSALRIGYNYNSTLANAVGSIGLVGYNALNIQSDKLTPLVPITSSTTITGSNVLANNETRLAACETTLAGKASSSHTHTLNDITNYTAPDLSSYATTSAMNTALSGKANTNHRHVISDITDINTIKNKTDNLSFENALADAWTTDNGTKLPKSNWSSIRYGNGKFIAVSNSGSYSFAYSSDGINWTTDNGTKLPIDNWQSVCYGNGKFVVVSNNGSYSFAYSEDGGDTWTTDNGTKLPIDKWQSICYGNGAFVAVTNYGTHSFACSEDDGDTWTTDTGTKLMRCYWRSVCYGDDKFVAIASYGNRSYAYSSNGKSWTSASGTKLPTLSYWESVCYGNGKFVTVGGRGNTSYSFAYTDNVENAWTTDTGTKLPRSKWVSVCYGNGKFVAVNNNGSHSFAYSEDGINWTSNSGSKLPITSWDSVCYGNGKFVAVCNGGSCSFAYINSLNSYSASGTITASNVLANNETRLAACESAISNLSSNNSSGGSSSSVDSNGNLTANSVATDELAAKTIPSSSWSQVSFGNSITTNANLYSASFTNGRLFVVDYSGSGDDGRFLVSEDYGQTWQSVNTSNYIGKSKVVYVMGNHYCLTNPESSDLLMIGNDYSYDDKNIGSGFKGIVCENGLAIVYSNNGCKYSTNGGRTWSGEIQYAGSSSFPSGYTINDMYFDGYYFYFYDSDYEYVYSTNNGYNWGNDNGSLPNRVWDKITYANGVYVALSTTEGTEAAYSSNGRSWTIIDLPVDNPTTDGWTDIVHDGQEFIALKQGSTEGICSTDGINWTSFTGPCDSNQKQLVATQEGIYCFIPGQSYYYKLAFPKISSPNLIRASNLSFDNEERLRRLETFTENLTLSIYKILDDFKEVITEIMSMMG